MKLHQTKNTNTTGIAIGHFGQAHWQHVDTSDGREAQVGPIYLTQQEALANHETYLVDGGWKKPAPDNTYTVVLLYPDYLTENFGQDVYTAHVAADTTQDALKQAQTLAQRANRISVDDPEDFALVVMFRGHHNAEFIE